MNQPPERYRVMKVFLERSENKDRFRIRAIDDKQRTVELSFAADKLAALRSLVESFHEWQKRGWNPEGEEAREMSPRERREAEEKKTSPGRDT